MIFCKEKSQQYQTSSKPSVVLVINSIQGGGAERSVLTLGQGFYELGYTVHVICFLDTIDYDLNPNLNYHIVPYKQFKLYPTRKLRYYLLAKTIEKYIQKNISNCRLVLANLMSADRMLRYLTFKSSAHIIRNTFSIEYQSALARKRTKTLKNYGNVYSKHPCICVSQGVEQDFKEVFGNSVKTHTIYNAFDKTSILTMADEFVPEHKGYIVHVGKFKYQKAHDILLKAYSKSSQKYPLLLLGKGKLLEPMKQLAKELGISKKVHFLGFHKNPYPYIKHARGMVLSSRFEGFVRVVLEALAIGTPVVSTDCPSGPNEVLTNKHLVAVDDIEALAKKMSEMMDSPDNFIAPFEDRFLPKNIAQQYIDYFEINNDTV